MWQKSIKIFVLLLLLLTTTGYTISRHYCGSRLVSVKVNSEPKSCCSGQSATCCHNVGKYFQLKDVYLGSFQGIQTIDTAEYGFYYVGVYAIGNDFHKTLNCTESPPAQEQATFLSILQTYLL